MELISDGNITLMRAVESFDFHKGNRFSTYATFALMKGFARSVPQMLYREKACGDVGMLEAIPDGRGLHSADRMLDRDEVRSLLSRLDGASGMSFWPITGSQMEKLPEVCQQPMSRWECDWGFRSSASGRLSRRRWRSCAGPGLAEI